MRLWEGVWVTDAGDALADADLQAALTRFGPMGGWEEGVTFIGGLDLAVRRDHAGLAILGADHFRQRVRLADAKEWAPMGGRDIDLIAVKDAIREAHRRFGLAALFFDPSQAQLMVQELVREGLSTQFIEVCQHGKASAVQATALLEGFRSRRIDLYDDHRMMRDLKKLRLVEKSTGIRLDAVSDETGHADLAKAFSFALPDTMGLCNQVLINAGDFDEYDSAGGW